MDTPPRHNFPTNPITPPNNLFFNTIQYTYIYFFIKKLTYVSFFLTEKADMCQYLITPQEKDQTQREHSTVVSP